MANLQILTGIGKGQILRLPDEDRTVVGRHTDCDIVLDDTMVKHNGRLDRISGRHTVIVRAGDNYTARALPVHWTLSPLAGHAPRRPGRVEWGAASDTKRGIAVFGCRGAGR